MVPTGLFVTGTRQVRCARCKYECLAKTPNSIDVVAPPSVTAPPLKAQPPQPAPEKKIAPEPAATGAPAEDKPAEKLITNLPAVIRTFNWKQYLVWAAALFALLCFILAWPVLDRRQIVKAFPSLRGLYEVTGLSVPKTGEGLVFDKVSSELRYDSGTMKLFVDGVIRNTTQETQFIPDIRASARAADQSAIQSWWVDAPAVTIEAGGEVPFHTEIGATTQKTIEDVYLEFTPRDEKHDAAQ